MTLQTEFLGRLLVGHYVSHASFPEHSLACEGADSRHSGKHPLSYLEYTTTSVSSVDELALLYMYSLRRRELLMDASRCFRGGDLGSGRPLRRFSGLWNLLLPRDHYCPSDNLNRHPDRLRQLRLSPHDMTAITM
jgi:hypothetical protein